MNKQIVLVNCVIVQLIGVIILAVLFFSGTVSPITTGSVSLLLGVVGLIEIYGNTHKFFKISNAVTGTLLVVLGIMQLLECMAQLP